MEVESSRIILEPEIDPANKCEPGPIAVQVLVFTLATVRRVFRGEPVFKRDPAQRLVECRHSERRSLELILKPI